MTLTRRTVIAIALTVPFAAACTDESLAPADVVDGIFARYAALGNSVTAGVQSGGINDSTQSETYTVRLAEAFGLEVGRDFIVPSLTMPGCPPPIVNIFTLERVDTIPNDCAFRTDVARQLNNVAVPSAEVIDILTNLDPASNPNPLTSLFLGGRTQLEAAMLIDPTFVSVWIGNNDVLGALTDATNPGDPSLITRVRDFQARYDTIMAGLDIFPSLQGGVLIGVIQVVFAPYASSGGAYWLASQSLPALTVDANCLDTREVPGTTDTTTVLVPFHIGAPIMADVAAGTPRTLDCVVDPVITAGQAAFMTLVVDTYNQIIEQHATTRGWAYVDPNEILQDLLQDPTKVRPFPAFDPADPQHVDAPFGTALSRDGVHPSAASHELLAEALIAAISAKYGTSSSGQ